MPEPYARKPTFTHVTMSKYCRCLDDAGAGSIRVLLNVVDKVIHRCHAGLQKAAVQLGDCVSHLHACFLSHSALKDLGNEHATRKLAFS